jgi:hypothetical protein
MTVLEAMKKRHTVRKYMNRQLPKEIIEKLNARIKENNEKYGLHVQLVTENTDAFGGLIKLILAKGVRNYIVLTGKNTPDVDEKLGYCGIDVALFAQTLGLNSWWVGGTFSKKKVSRIAGVSDNEKMTGVIAIGYGAEQGKPHKSKKAEGVSSYKGTVPEWFEKGVEAALLAPTALNKQAFMIKGDTNKVSISCSNGIFTGTDLGIVKYHFEVGAGKENFEWV